MLPVDRTGNGGFAGLEFKGGQILEDKGAFLTRRMKGRSK